MSSSDVISGFPTAPGLTVESWSTAEISKLVERTKWGDAMTGKEVELLARYLHVCRADQGAVIVREGGREAYLCLIVEGRSSVVKAGKKIGAAGADRVVGEMSLIDGEPRSASVVADEPTLFLVLTADEFNRLSSEVPRIAVKLLLKISKLISQRLRQTSGALLERLG
jgi:CRP/FNR family cyclic AMP-dependent transcriptional regulator